MNSTNVDWLRYVWIIPIVTGFITFILTSLFTIYREKKSANSESRAFIQYEEFELSYPFENVKKYGEGMLLLSENGRKLVEKGGRTTLAFLILKNITDNDVINVKIESEFQSKEGKVIREEFAMPVWNSNDVLYIPQSVYGSSSYYSTNIELTVSYSTLGFENFKSGYKRMENGKYKDFLKKKYFKLFYWDVIKYHQSEFFRFIKITEPKAEPEAKSKTDEDEK
ncbi:MULTISPECIES: hypothetical protein [Bacillus cereus group]|uniref:hypothetical protein n=1 Tax=Bacillus cereus group TaxID=86661 RepID=UPI000B441CFC|nr:hypothetical protein [Bacillus thuringiensis]ARZ61509.1 hypothetical protein B7P25_06690 [Bacillus thuringiensis]